ncbi:uncharacterized protein EI90DRAFT_3093142, partial [Cantharellus anzutake]|uniref:uncharacterized protein n=1 Tax=Cantharellus anzutake TaxID=1750568 RepID=UPI001904252E
MAVVCFLFWTELSLSVRLGLFLCLILGRSPTSVAGILDLLFLYLGVAFSGANVIPNRKLQSALIKLGASCQLSCSAARYPCCTSAASGHPRRVGYWGKL